MYTLTLTSGERQAFNWVGLRYESGEIAILLRDCMPEDAEWSSGDEITFTIPEHVAWEINELAEEGFPCFGPDLVAKLNTFIEEIV